MGSGSATPPSVPGLTAEERNLLIQQGVTLDQFNSILQQENINQTQNQNLLRQLSGLYDVEDVPAGPGDIKFTTRGGDLDSLGAYARQDMLGNVTLGRAQSWRSKDSGFNRRGSEIAAELVRAGFDPNMSVSQAIQTLQNDPQQALKVGFATQTENPASQKFTLRQEAVDDLRSRISNELEYQNRISDLEGKIYEQGLLGLEGQIDQITELNQLELDRRQKALEGKLPVSQGLIDRKAEDFGLLKESAARSGILIEGDTPESATSSSTSGNELLGQFNRTYGLLENAERHGELMSTVTPSQVQGASPYAGTNYGTSLNFATAGGAGGLLPAYGQLSQLYGGAASPFANQRYLSYQGQLNSYNANQQRRASLTSLLGYGGGLAINKNPLLGAGLLGAGAFSSLY